jgi:hypothetical protein
MSLPVSKLLVTFSGGVYAAALGLLLVLLGCGKTGDPLFDPGDVPKAIGYTVGTCCWVPTGISMPLYCALAALSRAVVSATTRCSSCR